MTEEERTAFMSPAFPRRVPAMVIYLHPFRIIGSSTLDDWSVSIEEINRQEWDYIKLHEIAGGIDVGLPDPYHMVVGRDGALALPTISMLRSDQEAVEFFNRCLAALLLVGIYCTSVNLDHLEFGSIIDWKYIRSTGGPGGANRFHELIRRRAASPLEGIALLNPRTISFKSLEMAAEKGFALLKSVPQLSPEFLLKGVSGIARRDWGLALSNLWIIIEQLTEYLWQRHIIEPVQIEDNRIIGRLDQLRDNRTWSAANRHELLFSKGILSDAILRQLYVARKARNELSHRGTHPNEIAARSAYNAAVMLFQCIVGDEDIPLARVDLSDHSLSDPFKPHEAIVLTRKIR